MAAINHHPIGQASCLEFSSHRGNGFSVEVGLAATTAQHQMTIGVPGGGHDRGVPLTVDPQEMVRPSGGLHGVDRHGHPTIGAVLEANGH